MRRFVLIITLLAVSCLEMSAQKAIFLFDDFVEAEIGFRRGGAPVKALFNFDTDGQKLYYMDGDRIMEMTNCFQLDTIKVRGRIFVWQDSDFCELFRRNGHDVYINWHLTESYAGKQGAMGLTTQGKAESYYVPGLNSESSFENGSRYEDRTDVWKRKSDNTYYFSCKGRCCKARRVQEIYKAFPEYKDSLKDFVLKGNLIMSNADDALQIIDYLYTL